jgi:F-type H+-transporting ATPase subunit b
MEIIKNFGIEPVLLIAQIVNFLIIAFILKKLLYKPVLEVLKKRKDEIKDGLKQAEESKLALEKALEEEKKILKKAQDQARKILDDAKNQSILTAQEIEEKTRAQSEKILEESRKQIEEEVKMAEKRLTSNVNKLSIDILKKSLKETFTGKDEDMLIDRAVKEIVK